MIYVYRNGRVVPKDNTYVGVSRGPYVISDTMEPTEQVNGKFYTSKATFRAVGRELGLIEVGTEKPKPFVRSTDRREVKAARRQALKNAVEKYKAGHRV
jgi:hypothetical protein